MRIIAMILEYPGELQLIYLDCGKGMSLPPRIDGDDPV
jgi:hypothetical protein